MTCQQLINKAVVKQTYRFAGMIGATPCCDGGACMEQLSAGVDVGVDSQI